MMDFHPGGDLLTVMERHEGGIKEEDARCVSEGRGRVVLGYERKDTWQRVIIDGYVPLWSGVLCWDSSRPPLPLPQDNNWIHQNIVNRSSRSHAFLCGFLEESLFPSLILTYFSPQLQDKIWEWPGNEATLFPQLLLRSLHSYVCIWLEEPGAATSQWM